MRSSAGREVRADRNQLSFFFFFFFGCGSTAEASGSLTMRIIHTSGRLSLADVSGVPLSVVPFLFSFSPGGAATASFSLPSSFGFASVFLAGFFLTRYTLTVWFGATSSHLAV